jgi:hypothetical protein
MWNMFDNVGDYMDYINKLSTGDTSEHVEADCIDIYSQAAKSINELYNQGSKSFTKYYGNMFPYVLNSYIYHPLQMSTLPQMIDITDKKTFVVLGIFEYDSIPHDMKLLIFAESEEKARELIDETYSTDTSFFMIKNIKEA